MAKVQARWVVLLMVFGSAVARAESSEIVVLEKKDGRASELNFSREQYSGKMERVMSSVSGSVLPALESHGDRGDWKLRAVLVGLGVSFEAGLGPILGVAAKSKFELVFTRVGDSYAP